MICIFNVPTSSNVLINGGMEEKKTLRKKDELKRYILEVIYVHYM